jgi:hypothetical protein
MKITQIAVAALIFSLTALQGYSQNANSQQAQPWPQKRGSTYFMLTMTDDGNGTTYPISSFSVVSGGETFINAKPKAGYAFNGWTVVRGYGVFFRNAKNANTTAKLTSGNAVIKANFVQIDSPKNQSSN